MSDHSDDLENRGRRNNIRIVGLTEGVEGDNPTQFFESWLPKILNIQTKTGRIKLERAHRSLAARSTLKPVLVRFHNILDKQRVMNVSRETGKQDLAVRQGNAKVMVFHDSSTAVIQRHKQFDEVKKRPRTVGAEYSQLYPALLRVMYCEVDQYIDSLDLTTVGNV